MPYKILDLVRGEYLCSYIFEGHEYIYDTPELAEVCLLSYLDSVVDVLEMGGRWRKMSIDGQYSDYKPIREHFEIVEVD